MSELSGWEKEALASLAREQAKPPQCAECERLRERIAALEDVLRIARAVAGDAISIAEIRYKKDVKLFSPWPELADLEKRITGVLNGR